MPQTKTVPQLKVAISKFHDGQIVHPVITAKAAGKGRATVELYWLDDSDHSHLRPGTFTGLRDEAERWLLDQGVRLDAQGIYGW